MKSTITQIKFDLNKSEYTLYLHFGGNDHVITLTPNDAIAVIDSMRMNERIAVDIEMDELQKFIYYVPFESKG